MTAGVGGLLLLVALRPDPPREERERISPLVTTAAAEAAGGAIYVTGSGTVVPTREVSLVAETAGKITSTATAFVSGGVFERGTVLAQIDPADYENAVAVAEAEVTQRRFELLRAQEEADVAREEWERLRRRTGADAPESSELGSLVLKEPQLRLAESMLRSAEARLADAQNRLKRTRIVAPFNGRVRRENVDVGQFVSPGQSVGIIYSTDVVEISVPLSTREAALIEGLWDSVRSRRVCMIHFSPFPRLGG